MSATLSSVLEVEQKAALGLRFPVKLARVCARFGLSRQAERELRGRHLQEGVDWADLGARGIRYAAEGVERLGLRIADLGSRKDGTPEAGAEGARAEPGGPRLLLPERCASSLEGEAVFRVRVMRVGFLNPRVVEVAIDAARPGGPAERGFMAVKDSVNFLPGMGCWCRRVEGQANWVFMGRGDREPVEGSAGPRNRGRW